ncbi:MAG TPA: PAS domain-containing sensor histidine kinase [Firmicutes bacterium]|jgi:two-component system phosphate regulon sensor histidine kinase PhoR|nr:PAS domain-containing sensor histidine kinase [Bacillota bacterium]
MRRLRLQLICGLILLLVPVFLLQTHRSGFSTLALLWAGLAGYLINYFYLNPLEKLWKTMRTLDPGTEVYTYKKFMKKVNERVKNQEQMVRRETKAREEVESILFSMVEGVIATDSSGKLSFMNPTAERLFQIEHGSALGKYPREVWREFELVEMFHQVFVSGQPQTREFQLDSPHKVYLKVEISPIRQEEYDEVQGVLAMVRDFTRLRRLENLRTDFVANVSHELRTPLTSIKGFIETLLDGGLESRETTKRFLTIMYQETDRLNRLISDLLDLSRIESGQTGLNRTKTFLAPLVEEVRLTLQERLAEKNISLSVELGPTPVWADEDQIREVLFNLIDNAIKYSTSGGSIKVLEINRGDRQEFVICDAGIGIPKDSIPRIFERFYRVDKARSREMGGTGLGLSIVKHIIERHEGKVWVESEPGKGSCFHFLLSKYEVGAE